VADEKDTKVENPEDKLVEAQILKNTSIAGQLLLVGTRHMIPLWRAKKMREAGTARPVPKVVKAVPAVPPPKPAVFDGEDDEVPSEPEEKSEE
jgi:hypothetical protein